MVTALKSWPVRREVINSTDWISPFPDNESKRKRAHLSSPMATHDMNNVSWDLVPNRVEEVESKDDVNVKGIANALTQDYTMY
jgi:hypothetical protein